MRTSLEPLIDTDGPRVVTSAERSQHVRACSQRVLSQTRPRPSLQLHTTHTDTTATCGTLSPGGGAIRDCTLLRHCCQPQSLDAGPSRPKKYEKEKSLLYSLKRNYNIPTGHPFSASKLSADRKTHQRFQSSECLTNYSSLPCHRANLERGPSFHTQCLFQKKRRASISLLLRWTALPAYFKGCLNTYSHPRPCNIPSTHPSLTLLKSTFVSNPKIFSFWSFYLLLLQPASHNPPPRTHVHEDTNPCGADTTMHKRSRR